METAKAKAKEANVVVQKNVVALPPVYFTTLLSSYYLSCDAIIIIIIKRTMAQEGLHDMHGMDAHHIRHICISSA